MSIWLKLLLVSAVFAAATALGLHELPRTSPRGGPVLSGAPQFILLSLIAALSLYLRQVNLHAVDARYKIFHRKSWNRLPERPYRERRIAHLQDVSGTITVVSPFMIGLMIVLCARIAYESYTRFTLAQDQAPLILYQADWFISIWLLLIMAGLTAAHFIARIQEGRIHRAIKKDLEIMARESMPANREKSHP